MMPHLTGPKLHRTTSDPASTAPQYEVDIRLEEPQGHMSLVCNIVTRGTLPGVMVGVLTSDVSISPLYNCPMMVTWATTLNWYTPLGLRLLMSPEVVVGGKV